SVVGSLDSCWIFGGKTNALRTGFLDVGSEAPDGSETRQARVARAFRVPRENDSADSRRRDTAIKFCERVATSGFDLGSLRRADRGAAARDCRGVKTAHPRLLCGRPSCVYF